MSRIATFLGNTLNSASPQSFGRFASLLTLAFCLGWDTAYVWFVMSHFGLGHFNAGDILPAAGTLLAEGGFCSLFYAGGKLADKVPTQGTGNRD